MILFACILEFSINKLCVSIPPQITPARYKPGILDSWLFGSNSGFRVLSFDKCTPVFFRNPRLGSYPVMAITQSLAIEKSLQSFNRVMLENHLKEHVAHQFREGKEDKAINELLKIYFLNNK